MRPTLEPGDRLLCRRVRAGRVRIGDLVAVRDPRDGRLLVKRVRAIDAETGALTIEGDNAARSTDSRTFGVVDPGRIVGRAVYRYAPEGRRGKLRP